MTRLSEELQEAQIEPRLGDTVALESQRDTKRPRVGVVLAAGLSSRMGSNKMLFELDGESVLPGFNGRLSDLFALT